MLATVDFDSDIASPLAPNEQETVQAGILRMVAAAQITNNEDSWEVAFRITSDSTIHELNRRYRHIDKATDVLAFPQQEGPGCELVPDVLGDIVVSLETARSQAKHGVIVELLTLAAHGLCHLLGYDHQNDEEETEMNARVNALLAEAQKSGPITGA